MLHTTIAQILHHRANGFPQVEAAVDSHQRFTYEQLNQQANQIANWLKQQNVQRGDRVALLCHNSISMMTIWLATAKIGAIVQPLNVKLNVQEFIYILNDGEPKILFYDKTFASVIPKLSSISSIEQYVQIGSSETSHTCFEQLLYEQPITEPEHTASPDDPFLLIYTSGTTGKPKGVIISHRNICCAGYNIGNHFDYRSFDRNLIITPMFHISGYMFSVANLLRGATTIFADFHPKMIWDLIEQEQITQFLAVPAMLKLMMNETDWMKKNIDSLRYIVCGADSVPPQLIQQYNSFGIEVCHGYGCTEFSGTTASWTKGMDPNKKHTAGKPFPFTQLKIVDPQTGQQLPNGMVGEIVYKGPQCFQGYWKNQAETDKVLKDGWYYSGDMGKLDEDGFLIIVDRYKDMIISSGENIYPAEIEGVLLDLDGIQEVSVVGAPDPIHGQIPMAFVVKRPHSKLKKEDIIAFCHSRLASFKCGEHIEFIDELPRNASGKVQKDELRKRAKEIMELKNKE